MPTQTNIRMCIDESLTTSPILVKYHAKRVQSIKTLTVITNKYERSFRTRATQKKRHIYAVLKYDYADRFIEQV